MKHQQNSENNFKISKIEDMQDIGKSYPKVTEFFSGPKREDQGLLLSNRRHKHLKRRNA